ncbi:MAG: hypothetical protein QF483_02710 [Gammaproteobacteria bacterium]|nr:hypothetical protein [Chromatiales bacterium]MDP7154591.1 hypothetical protein [Gammaproteobacteria bacterium]MDP7296499.1 hypothetical protein [Gammaproteobacteria bacterium]MDP7418774.1 hypothetical protein [Gammaproteobacteria bacterium]MDP7660393.1 hypothetical protein [Gammaproteobacteria bacterium]
MTKTNRFTLIATVLLGILLYTILQFAHDLNVAWDGSPLEPPAKTSNQHATTVPRITGAVDLHNMFADGALDAALNDYAAWSDARGFAGNNRLFAAPVDTPSNLPADMDETALRTRSEAGDVTATQALAAQMLFADPFAAIALFRRAAEQGSTFALLRIGSLLAAIDTADAYNEATSSAPRQRIADLIEPGLNHSLRLTAFGYMVTALRDGGAPIVDHDLLNWLDRINDSVTNDERLAVCRWSERTLMEIAKRRVRWGKPAVTTITPKMFFAIPDLAERLPCRRTVHPIDNLMDLTHCTVSKVRNAADQDLDLYICKK